MNMLNRLAPSATGFQTPHKTIDADDEIRSSKPIEFTLFDFVSFVTSQANPIAVEISRCDAISLVSRDIYRLHTIVHSILKASLRSQTGNEID
ncbi:hypothetical protein [Lysobacter antibioticus]|uniref:hypothetical protein n=1 Tax=Lysobacter antibioticus TaxID=84531 RepID=UPI0013779E72|nr:hypothetical protein [Lysobacter antibioticus]